MYKIIFGGEMLDDEFDSYEEAEEMALYYQSCERDGAEILNMSNPGDYPFDEDSFQGSSYEIVEVD